jgi:FKBP12-rapamycin complex-associated protein
MSLQKNVDEILHAYFLATRYDPTWYKAWHTWALANFELIGHMEAQSENRTYDIPGNGLAAHVVQAVEGMRSRYDPAIGSVADI